MTTGDGKILEQVYFIGTGLMGGSLALDLKARGLVRNVAGYDIDPDAAEYALQHGILDEIIPPDSFSFDEADIVVLSLPVIRLRELLLDGFPDGTLVTDVGSVKLPLVNAYKESISAGKTYSYVPGHPIAGDEKSGPSAARKGLFEGARVILTPIAGKNDGTRTVTDMWEGVGSTVEIMDPEQHDEVYAWVSHLPHMMAYALVNAVNERESKWAEYSAGGLRDYTRIASSSPRMWADIAVVNKEYLLKALDGLGSSIESIRELIRSSDRDALEDMFKATLKARRKYK